MVEIPGGQWTTGMKPPLPYGIVDTTAMAVVDAPERRCPEAVAATPGATACWVQTDLHDPVVPIHRVRVEPFCIEKLPFPGGGPYAPDGMSTWDARSFDELLSSGRFGSRRMCTYTEYELAVSGPRRDLRFVYGDRPRPDLCPGSESQPIGSHPGCTNPETGVSEYGAVVAQWVRLDQQLVDTMCPDPATCRASGGARLDERDERGSFKLRYVVAGGTRRVQTRQAPYTPHTFHDHGQPTGPGGCDAWGWDDGPVVCADPDPLNARCAADPSGPGCRELAEQEDYWAGLEEFCRGRRMSDCLSRGLSYLAGRPVDACPGGGEELGPGQGR